MRTFDLVLIAAALATFTSAVPFFPLPPQIPQPPGVTADVTIRWVPLGSLLFPAGAFGGQVNSVKGEVSVDVRGLKSEVTDAVESVESRVSDVRPVILNIEGIFENITAQLLKITQPFEEVLQKAGFKPLANLLVSIRGAIELAVPVAGSIISEQVNDLTAVLLTQLANTVSNPVSLVIDVAGKALNVTTARGSDVDVEQALADLGNAVTSLVAPVVAGVDGVNVPLVTLLTPYAPAVSALGWNDLADLIGLEL